MISTEICRSCPLRKYGSGQKRFIPMLLAKFSSKGGNNRHFSPARSTGQNYGAGYLFLSLKSFASWRLERSGRETDRKLLFDVEGKGRMRTHAKTQRRKGGKGGRGLGGMFQFHPVGLDHDLQGQNYGAGYLFLSLESFASWRLERSGREILIGNCFSTWRGKGG